jgi:D-alanyl-lipoteichoic acid acyltransferase DltB (MBOAT superfamily)
MFYPQLVAGPIERPQNLLHQFHEEHHFSYENLLIGLRLMLWGLFKKIVIADRLAIYVNQVYRSPDNYSALNIVVATFFFAYQVYFDFAGYSDIALGSARVMGFNLMVNFNHPFQSRNITEFWRRWHISLSTWFNDYLFTPFISTYRDWGKNAIAAGLFITFFISGVWHGAGWNFVIFGVLHGAAMIYEFQTKKFRNKLSKQVPKWWYDRGSQFITFIFLLFAWIFFRSPTFNTALFVVAKIFTPVSGYFKYQVVESFGILSWLMAAACCIYVLTLERFVSPQLDYFNTKPRQDTLFFVVNLVLLICFGVFDKATFIYFQF